MSHFKLGVPWLVVVLPVALGLAVVFGGHVRVGGILMAVGPLLGAIMRAVLPERVVPDLKVRSRGTDVALYALGAIVTFVAFTGVKLG